MERCNGESCVGKANAIKNEEDVKEATPHAKVYICSPYRADTETEVADNVRAAIRWCQAAVKAGFLPIAPHIYITRFLDDAKSNERSLGLAFGLELLGGCNEVWVCGGKVSEGMRKEITEAERRGIRVKYVPKEEIKQ